MVKVLVVDDLPALRANAAKVAQRVMGDDVRVIEAANASEALGLFKKEEPDLIVLDISMPDGSGIKVAESIWREQPAQKILFWSQFHNESYVRAIHKVLPDDAIHGYALKGEGDESLGYAMQSVLVHENSFIDPIVRGHHVKLKSKNDALTDIEYETLIDVAIGLTDRAIATRRHISVRGVQKRISSLLDKLMHGETEYFKESTGVEVLNPRTRLICVAMKRGLLLPEDLNEPEAEMFEWLDKEKHRLG